MRRMSEVERGVVSARVGKGLCEVQISSANGLLLSSDLAAESGLPLTMIFSLGSGGI